jgi:iduronate 2-sulfatase
MCVVDGDESQLYDYRLMTHTIATIQRVAAMDTPWYVMAGFRRPHRAFQVHQKYWDLYPDSAVFATAKHKTRSESQPLVAFHAASFALPNGSTYNGNPDLPWPTDIQQVARKAYAACVTQTDSYVGQVLNTLDATGQADKTIVVLHSGTPHSPFVLQSPPT